MTMRPSASTSARRFVLLELGEGLLDGAVAVVRAISVHDERQVLGVPGDGEVRAQVDLGHGPSLGSVGRESGQFAHRATPGVASATMRPSRSASS